MSKATTDAVAVAMTALSRSATNESSGRSEPATSLSKITLRSFCKRSIALVVALSCGAALRAGAQLLPAPSMTTPLLDLSGLTDPEKLRLAHLVLLPGNHNYWGHRVAAMRALRAAAYF